ncbi:transporter [Aspergillus sp. HF37]|nr:transporter [Aspergillus sp. HF37]
MWKPGNHHIEGIAAADPPSGASHDLENRPAPSAPDQTGHLTDEHRAYLIQRHGTAELDPIPDMSDADPYNWPT